MTVMGGETVEDVPRTEGNRQACPDAVDDMELLNWDYLIKLKISCQKCNISHAKESYEKRCSFSCADVSSPYRSFQR